MGFAKVLGIILILLLIPVGVIGFDLYQTSQTVQSIDYNEAISSPSYTIADDNSSVTVTVSVDLPKAGFLQKGVIFDVSADFDGEVQSQSASVAFGESKNISLTFELTQEHKETIASGGSLTVSATADVTPTYFGFPIDQLSQQVDLGSKTISR